MMERKEKREDKIDDKCIWHLEIFKKEKTLKKTYLETLFALPSAGDAFLLSLEQVC